MEIMFITFGVFLLVSLVMSIGVICGKKPIKGSCGGLNSLGLKENCPICGSTSNKKTSNDRSEKSTDELFYDAAKLPRK